jgi:hypothetical protein
MDTYTVQEGVIVKYECGQVMMVSAYLHVPSASQNSTPGHGIEGEQARASIPILVNIMVMNMVR